LPVRRVHNRDISASVAPDDLHGAAATGEGAAAREIGIVLFSALTYFGVRILVEGSTARATANADRIMRLESTLGIDIEHTAQQVVLDHDVLRFIGNSSYVWLHWPLLIAILIVLYRRDRGVYLRLRRALVASGIVGLVLFLVMPTAPPRFMPGFEGTVSDAARRHYLSYPMSWANKYASMPSFHVGWTVIACLALAAILPSSRAKMVAMVPGVLVALAVVTTGNHYVLDVVVGLVIALAAYRITGARDRVAAPSRRAAGAASV
jgi:membrane-associated phospholipid phosphatase